MSLTLGARRSHPLPQAQIVKSAAACNTVACKNILLVDDNQVIGKLARKLLVSMGMEVTMAYDGQTALRYDGASVVFP